MRKLKLYIIMLAGLSLLFSLIPQSPWVHAEEAGGGFEVLADGTVNIDGMSFNSLSDYFNSKYFRAMGKRCGTMQRYQKQGGFRFPQGSTSDCSLSRTTIKSEYEPSQVYIIPIVFHVIYKTDGTGNLSDQRLADQVEVLNEDYRAMAGTIGSQGNDSMIQFTLEDITRTANNTWYQDKNRSTYMNTLAWDQDRYLNVYVCSPSEGFLGESSLPQEDAGAWSDGIVMLNEVVGGRDLAGAGEFDQGRTLVHEIGHYLGLLHTFGSTYGSDGCYTGYTAGDLIADTNSERTAHYGCTQTNTCGTADPIHNYMNYTDDICMYKFTEEQNNRMICSLVNYRPNLYSTSGSDSITVTSPNGGESWNTGSTHNVTWTSTGSVGNVKISYSTNNGSNWTTITSSTTNDGSYPWTLPNTTSSQCLVRVNEASDTSVTDTSNAVFSIVGSGGADSITVTSPNGGESWDAGSTHNVTWTSTGSVGNVKISYSTNNGSNWTTITSSTTNDGSYPWTLPNKTSLQCLVRVNEASDTSITDTSDAVFSIVSASPPTISLNRTSFNFAGTTGGTATGGQTLLIDNSGGGTLQWTASPSAPWLSCSPSSGSGSGVVTVSVSTTGLGTGSYTGSVTVSDSNATNSPRTVTVYLDVMSSWQDEAPFGTFSTPTDGSVVSSSVPVTGWVLDDVQVQSVKIYRFTWAADIYIGDAVLVEGARPDIEAAYPDYPNNYKAGWGYMLLTNFLPNGGNGDFTIFAVAADSAGQEELLGWADITCNNASAVKPFGAIDTPAQGGDASGGSFRNAGWVLTPMPYSIPTSGSTINVYVDGVYLGHPTYNIYRPDIASLFPGYANSNGAHGYFDFDTTVYSNGIHSIYWTATDNGGNSDGIGSRYFTIQNTGGSRAASQSARRSVIEDGKTRFAHVPLDRSRPIGVLKGYREDGVPEPVYPGVNGITAVNIRELERVVLHLSPGTQLLTPLPVGSSLDVERGIFYWQAGPGYVGPYELVFMDTKSNRLRKINITISPKHLP